jgi:AcrR family transcriptional regulator
MGRPPKYANDQILDAASTVLSRGGPAAATVVAIAAELGAPSGSIYHRFASRDLILATLWVRTIRRFQAGYLEALGDPDLEAARAGAVQHVLRWSDDHPDDARILLMYNRDDLIAAWPNELGDDLATLNDGVEAAVGLHVMARFGAITPETVGRARLALIDVPYTAVRHSIITGVPIDDWLVDAALAASAAILNSPVVGTNTRGQS